MAAKPKSQVHLFLDPGLKARITEAAKIEGRTETSIMVRAVTEYLSVYADTTATSLQKNITI